MALERCWHPRLSFPHSSPCPWTPVMEPYSGLSKLPLVMFPGVMEPARAIQAPEHQVLGKEPWRP